MTILTIALAIKVFLEERGSPTKEPWKNWLGRVADSLKTLAGKAVEPLPASVGSAVDATLSFLGKAFGFAAEHTWSLIVFVAELVGWYKKLKRIRS